MELALPTEAVPGLPGDAPAYVHHFEPYEESEHLVVCIAGLHTDVTKPRTAWPYRPRMNVYRPWARHMAEILKSITGVAPE